MAWNSIKEKLQENTNHSEKQNILPGQKAHKNNS
jgi:hypothetical protein